MAIYATAADDARLAKRGIRPRPNPQNDPVKQQELDATSAAVIDLARTG